MNWNFTITVFKNLLVFYVLVVLPGSAVSSEYTTLNIGVRTDAAPFSYKVQGPELLRLERAYGDLGKKGYTGYVVQICDDVLINLKRKYSGKLQVAVMEIKAENRFSKLKDGSIDILCDPATIIEDRIYELFVSAPIYLSGISFAKQPEFPTTHCGHIVGFVGSTTSQTTGIRKILADGEWPRYNKTLTDFISNPDSWESDDVDCSYALQNQVEMNNPLGSQKVLSPIFAYKDHSQLADAFCAKKILYYVGDIEIVARKLRDRKSCKFELASKTYSDERYAIYMRAATEPSEKDFYILKFAEELARQIYQADSLLLKSFKNNFIGYKASPKLELFFWSITGRYP